MSTEVIGINLRVLYVFQLDDDIFSRKRRCNGKCLAEFESQKNVKGYPQKNKLCK